MPVTCLRLCSRLRSKRGLGRCVSDVSELAEKIGPAAAIDGDAGDVAEIDFGFRQAIGDGARREPRPVLEPAKPLLFGRGQEHTVAQDAGGRVGVVGVDPEYYQSGAVLRQQ